MRCIFHLNFRSFIQKRKHIHKMPFSRILSISIKWLHNSIKIKNCEFRPFSRLTYEEYYLSRIIFTHATRFRKIWIFHHVSFQLFGVWISNFFMVSPIVSEIIHFRDFYYKKKLEINPHFSISIAIMLKWSALIISELHLTETSFRKKFHLFVFPEWNSFQSQRESFSSQAACVYATCTLVCVCWVSWKVRHFSACIGWHY